MTDGPPPELAAVRRGARCLATASDVACASDAMAAAITTHMRDANPVVLGVMTGAIVPLALLLQRLDFPLQVDYVHLTRYGTHTSGGELTWIKRPPPAIRGRAVLIVDDILDQGVTLAAVVDECQRLGASSVLTAVLVTKRVERRAGLIATDFSGLELPDVYLFGCGLDYKTYLRNLPGIFAVGASL